MNINQVWPEWNEDCVLGEGSFGKVYRAKRVEYGRTFYSAIKVLTVPKNQQEIKFARSQGMNDEEIYNYFHGLVDNLLNEITLMDNLKGAKNIVGIEDYKIIEREGEIGWDIFIRMELLTPFDSFVSNPDFSQKDVIRLGVDICTALEVCEQNYIVHRDIKPDNIFISRFGEYKLGDFGIARKLEVTQANLSRKGTLNYMAPEVYKSEEYGSNVDVYSLGLVLYTLLNNNRIAFMPPYPQPISYKDNEEALSKRLSGTPLIPPCNASASLGATIVKACAYRPQDRYQTATEFKNALIAEWNILVQSGDNREINSDAMRFGSNIDQQMQNTTNDMTANGRLVVDEYAQGTTVLDQSGPNTAFSYDGSTPSFDLQGNGSVHSGEVNVTVPASYSTVKSSKLCRIFAWPLLVAVCVFAFILLFKNEISAVEKMVGFSLLGVGLTALISDRNKRAVGISVMSLSLSYVVEGLGELIGGGLQDGIPVPAVISLLSGLLLLFGGVVILTQKEVRLGGSLCVYAVAIEWLFNIYQIINNSFSIELWHIFYGIAAVSVFVWAYGYKSDEKATGVKKILHIVTYVLAAAVAVQAIVFAVISFSALLN
ncbi:MAG: serine/threonine protein kinase [Ruminococcus sp.]|nr:serine/threonine protein kinase [Ruminococcus sp.]MBQ4283206.1 serine/threonine protein kinase [Lachnospira sp.]